MLYVILENIGIKHVSMAALIGAIQFRIVIRQLENIYLTMQSLMSVDTSHEMSYKIYIVI